MKPKKSKSKCQVIIIIVNGNNNNSILVKYINKVVVGKTCKGIKLSDEWGFNNVVSYVLDPCINTHLNYN